MFENIMIGQSYTFVLSNGETRQGKVDYMDNEVITLWNDSYGEVEVKKVDCMIILPLDDFKFEGDMM